MDVDGVARELFSVRELNDGGLLVRINHHINHEDYDTGANCPIEAERISVHPSPSSPGTTIKRTTILTDTRVMTSALFVKDSKANLLAHLFTKMCANLSTREAARPRQKDLTISVGAYGKADLTTLLFSVFVTTKDRTPPLVRGYAIQGARFHRFAVHVYSNYLNLPASPLGSILYSATRPEQIDGRPRRGPSFDGVDSLPNDLIPEMLLDLHQRAASHCVERLAARAPDMSDTLRNWPLWFHASPLDLALGRFERGI